MPWPCSLGSLCASFKDVEHPCQQCGATVEDGRPYCPQCRAPQIRVQVAAPEAAASLSSASDDLTSESFPSRHLVGAAELAVRWTGESARGCDQGRRAGLFPGMLVPFLALVVAGALAVFFYRRDSGLLLPPALAARIGGAAGVVAVAIQSFFSPSGFSYFTTSRNTSIR